MHDDDTTWRAYQEGMSLDWEFSFSDEDLRKFAALSGDYNPIHIDSQFAQSKGFPAPIMYGLLLASQISRLIGQELPDKNAILTGIEVEFLKAAFANEMLNFHAELLTKSEGVRALEFKCRIMRRNLVLCSAKATAIWRK